LADPTRTVFKALVGVDPQVANNVRALFPGMYARVRVPKGEPTPQFVLPEDCLLSGQEGRFLYVVTHEGTVEKRVVTVGASVWKAPPTVPGVAPPMWAAVNPNPPPPAEGQPPPPTRRLIRSIVAIPAGLKEGERVILDGLQQVRPNAPVAPEEWTLTPPAEPKKP
jgi:multidrug efflux pump subunit AcrA (membrane-fusion protein)